MEDSITVRVPQRRYTGSPNGSFTDDAHGNYVNRGNRMGAAGALMANIVQFMTGSPVVNYSSFAFSADLGTFDGVVEFIETSRPSTGGAISASFTHTTSYSHYTNNLMHNRSLSDDKKSTAVDTFTLRSTGSGGYYITHPTLGQSSDNRLLTSSGGSDTEFSPGADTDLYDKNGYFVLAIHITAKSGGAAEWPSTATATFSVTNPTYTDSLTWSDMANSNRSTGVGNSFFYSTLYYDGGRITTDSSGDALTSSDQMGLYDIQGLSFHGTNITCAVLPTASISHSRNAAVRGFLFPGTYSPDTNSIATHFTAGRAIGTTDPASAANRAVDLFTIFRGPGYVRMLGQVSAADDSPESAEADKDVSYFFGMFRPYATPEEYPHPMAFLGDVGYRSDGTLANRTRPWWRTSATTLHTSDSDIFTENFFNDTTNGSGYYHLNAPFILHNTFVMDDNTKNTPAFAKSLPAGPREVGTDYIQPIFWQDGNLATNITIGSVDATYRYAVTEFNGRTQAVSWDHNIGYDSPVHLFYAYLESPGAPRILPVTLRQIAPDDHGWVLGTSSKQQTIPASYLVSGVSDFYENIGEIPGIYWMNDIQRYNGSSAVTYPAGSQFTVDGRTLRMVIGFSQSSNANSAYAAVPGLSSNNSGNLLFDMNEI